MPPESPSINSPSGWQPQPEYICHKAQNDWLTFCAPNRPKEPFYVVTSKPPPEKFDEAISSIRKRFGNRAGEIIPSDSHPKDIPLNNKAQLFDISGIIGPFITDKNQTKEGFFGPNCFWAALAEAGILDKDKPRYVGTTEFAYYLTFFMLSVPPNRPSPEGAIAVFYYADEFPSEDCHQPAPCLFRPGYHAAIYSSGLYFQKISHYFDDPYKFLPEGDVMYDLDTIKYNRAYQKDRHTTVEKPNKKYYPHKYRPWAFVPTAKPIINSDMWLSSSDIKDIQSFNNDAAALEACRCSSKKDFETRPPGCVSSEAFAKFQDDFLKYKDKVFGSNYSLLYKKDPRFVAAYLHLESAIQFFEMLEDEFVKPPISNKP